MERRPFPATGAYPSLRAEKPPEGPAHPRTLKKELTLFGVYAIATGTTLSAGFFLLPSFAALLAGPAIVLAYIVAGLMLVPAMFSAVELATAMPRSGGAYYFLDRALGPLAGTIGGVGTWLALILKTAFALVGMGAYVAVLVPGDTPHWFYTAVAAGLALGFGALNLAGAKKTGGFQVVLVIGLLILLTAFIGTGLLQLDMTKFEGVWDTPPSDVMATAGLVFISYVGVTKVASVAEEVRDPERNLPRGVFLALSTALLIYILGLVVMVGVVGADRLAVDPGRGGLPDLTPVATTASAIVGPYGRVGAVVISVAALLAFSSVANAGILSASRYPLAMSRDKLLPRLFQRIGGSGAPTWGVLLTVGCIVALVFVDPVKIAKLASAFQLLMFGLLSLAVVVMRESQIAAYDPGFRSPLYPWMQIFGIVGSFFFIYQMGWMPSAFTLSLVVLGTIWYRKYASKRVERQGAILHVFERMGRHRFAGLDTELRGILKEKGLRDQDPFEDVVALADVIDSPEGESFESLAGRASAFLAEDIAASPVQLRKGFMEGTQIGATPVMSGVALPHVRLPDLDLARMVIVRSLDGVQMQVKDAYGHDEEPKRVAAIFFLLSPEGDPAQHLRMLAQLAGRVDEPRFMDRWLAAKDGQDLKEILLRDERHLAVHLDDESPWVGQNLTQLPMPPNCLIVMIHRDGQLVVPRGGTELESGDRLTVIGDATGIKVLRRTLAREKEARANAAGSEAR